MKTKTQELIQRRQTTSPFRLQTAGKTEFESPEYYEESIDDEERIAQEEDYISKFLLGKQ